jgi:hypothetical protein
MNFNGAAFTRSGSPLWAEAFAKVSGFWENDGILYPKKRRDI